MERRLLAPGEPVAEEDAVEVPDRQPVVLEVELGEERRRLGIERVEVRVQVPPDAVHVDELLDPNLLQRVEARGVLREPDRPVGAPPGGLRRHAQVPEDPVVELVATGQALLDVAKEQARLGALDDPVVVGRGQREDLADAEARERQRIGRLEAARPPERTDPDDRALAGHQPRDRLAGPERAGVRERDRGTAQVAERRRAGVDAPDQVLVGEQERAEVEGVGVAHDRHHERPRAVRPLDVDREAEADVLVAHDAGGALVVDRGHERRVQRGHLLEAAEHGEGDDVREGDLRPARAGEVLVHDRPVDLEQPGRHGAHAGRGRHLEAGGHVRRDRQRRAAQRDRPSLARSATGGAGVAAACARGARW